MIRLFHPRAQRTSAGQHYHVARLDLTVGLALNRRNGIALTSKDTCWALFAIDAIGIDHGRVDRRRLDYRSLRAEITDRETHRTGHAPTSCLVGWDDHVVGIHAITIAQELT